MHYSYSSPVIFILACTEVALLSFGLGFGVKDKTCPLLSQGTRLDHDLTKCNGILLS